MSRYGYQDDRFEVPEVGGEVLEELVVFLSEDGGPEKLLGRLRRGDAFHAFLSAFLGFWDELDEEGYASVRETYEGLTEVDLLATHRLRGAPILRAWCERVGGKLRITIRFAAGELRFEEVDPRDVDTDLTLRFVPADEEERLRLARLRLLEPPTTDQLRALRAAFPRLARIPPLELRAKLARSAVSVVADDVEPERVASLESELRAAGLHVTFARVGECTPSYLRGQMPDVAPALAECESGLDLLLRASFAPEVVVRLGEAQGRWFVAVASAGAEVEEVHFQLARWLLSYPEEFGSPVHSTPHARSEACADGAALVRRAGLLGQESRPPEVWADGTRIDLVVRVAGGPLRSAEIDPYDIQVAALLREVLEIAEGALADPRSREVLRGVRV